MGQSEREAASELGVEHRVGGVLVDWLRRILEEHA